VTRVEGSGGAKGWLDGACVPAINPCTPAVPQQASRHHFILLCCTSFSRFTVPYFTPTEANFLVLVAPEGRIWEANFQKCFRGDTQTPLTGGTTQSLITHARGIGTPPIEPT